MSFRNTPGDFFPSAMPSGDAQGRRSRDLKLSQKHATNVEQDFRKLFEES